MNLQHLYYFRTIAELQHFTKAAERLGVTQPSLSHSIGDLESELGVHLFERQGRNIRLTKYGRIFLEYVTEALDTLDEGRALLGSYIHPETGTVSLAYFSSLDDFIPYLITRYYEETERMHTVFQFYQAPNTSIESQLLDGTVDLAFSSGLESDKLRAHKIGEHGMVLIVPRGHRLAEAESVDLRLLRAERFVTYDHQCQIRTHIDEIFSGIAISPRIVSETTHDTIIFSSVAAGFGIALVPQPLGLRHDGVKALAIENPVPHREIFLTWKDMRYISPAVKKFRDFIIRHGLVLDEYRTSLSKR